MVGLFILPTKARARRLMAMIADPYAPIEEQRTPAGEAQEASTFVKRVRAGVQFVLMGPVVLMGFFGGTVSEFFLGSMLGFAWRQRKYLADATAVRLTRDPDTLARALMKMGGGQTIDSWADHLSVSHSGPQGQVQWLGANVSLGLAASDRPAKAGIDGDIQASPHVSEGYARGRRISFGAGWAEARCHVADGASR